jgi:hypothetical protein
VSATTEEATVDSTLVDLASELDRVKRSLVVEYAGRLPAATVLAVVDDAARSYRDAGVTHFVPMLVASRARHELARLTAPGQRPQ